MKLSTRKGYKLVATDWLGVNAFFVRADVAESVLPTIPIEQGFKHPKTIEGMRTRFPNVKDLPWVQI